jgi:hypothetical protein
VSFGNLGDLSGDFDAIVLRIGLGSKLCNNYAVDAYLTAAN